MSVLNIAYVLYFSPGQRNNELVVDNTIAELKTQKDSCLSLNMDDKENVSNNSSTTSGRQQYIFFLVS
jgi:hypothetical protein